MGNWRSIKVMNVDRDDADIVRNLWGVTRNITEPPRVPAEFRTSSESGAPIIRILRVNVIPINLEIQMRIRISCQCDDRECETERAAHQYQ